MKLVPLAHQLGLKASHFRQFLSSQSFIERTAFARLTQLLPFGVQLLAHGFVALGKALADLFHLSFLVVSEIEASEEPASAHSSHAFVITSAAATPFTLTFCFALATSLIGGNGLGNSDRGS